MDIKINTLIEYMKIHLISIYQDWEKAKNNEPLNEYEFYESDAFYEGEIWATEHLIKVANDMLNQSEG